MKSWVRKEKGKKRRGFLRKLGIATILAVLLAFLALLVLPRFINLNSIKGKITNELSEKLRADVTIENIKLRLIPKPTLEAFGISVSSPDFSLKTKGLFISVKLIPLLSKRIEVEKLILSSPDIVIKQGKARKKKEGPFSIPAIPAATLEIKNGALKIVKGKKSISLSSINGTLGLNKKVASLNLTLKGSFLDSAGVSGFMNLQKNSLKGKISISQLDLSGLPIPENLALKPGKTSISADIKVSKDGDTLSAAITLYPSKVALKSPNTTLDVERASCTLSISKGKTHILLVDAAFKDPALTLKKATIDVGKESSSIYIEGIRGSWDGVRDKLVTIFWNKKGVLKLCGIVRKGDILNAELESKSQNPGDLFDLRNLKIKGKVEKVETVIPKILMVADNLSCDFRLSGGILNLWKARAKVEGIDLENATFSLSLEENKNPISLESDLSSTLEDTKKVLGNLPLPESMALILRCIRGTGPFKAHVMLEGPAESPNLNFLRIEPEGVRINIKGLGLPITAKRGLLIYRPGFAAFSSLDVGFGRSFVHVSSGEAALKKKPIILKLTGLRGKLHIHDLKGLFKESPKRLKDLNTYLPDGGIVNIISASYSGPLNKKDIIPSLTGSATIENTELTIPDLPPATIERGSVSIKKGSLLFSLRGVKALGSHFPKLSGKVELRKMVVFLKGNGTVGRKLLRNVMKGMPDDLIPLTPLTVQGFSLERRPPNIKVTTTFKTPKSSWIDLSFEESGKDISSSINIKTEKGPFILSVVKKHGRIRFTSKGHLDKSDIKAILPRYVPFESMKIDLGGTLNLSMITESKIKGGLDAKGVDLKRLKIPLLIDHIKAQALGKSLLVKNMGFSMGKTALDGSGMVVLSGSVLDIKGSLESENIIIQDLKRVMEEGKTPGKKNSSKVKIDARITLSADNVTYKKLKLRNVKAILSYIPGMVKCTIEKADLCGIAADGRFTMDLSSGIKTLDLNFGCKNGELSDLRPCIGKEDRLFKGPFNLEGNLSTSGKKLLENTTGKLLFSSKGGRVYKFGLMDKLFTFLNPIDMFKGNLPDLGKKGFEYSVFEIDGKFKGNYLVIDSAQIVGSGLRAFSSGKIDLVKKRIDFTVLASPFKNVDSIISKIPLLGWILTGKSKTLLSVPVKIEGPMDNPTVVPADPTAVGAKMLGIVKRTLKLPVRIVNPLKRDTGKVK